MTCLGPVRRSGRGKNVLFHVVDNGVCAVFFPLLQRFLRMAG